MNPLCIPGEKVVKEDDSYTIPVYLNWKLCRGTIAFVYVFLKSSHQRIASRDCRINHESHGFLQVKPHDYFFLLHIDFEQKTYLDN